MPNPYLLPENTITDAFFTKINHTLFTGILRGIEKESLRVTEEGTLALTGHPISLGSALTHPQITTDFSEALMEFITPPSHRIHTVMEQLRNLHRFTYAHLGPDEMLWNNSMPCMIGNSNEIPVALYGSTNRGKMKTIYRVGLGHRYGRAMQTVAGVHFNFSLPDTFWAFTHEQQNSHEELHHFRTRSYFDLIRNFRRYYWLLVYLFGASPAMCRSFAKGRAHDLEVFNGDEHTLHLPYATSLRMGDLGYQSSAQENLYVCYNTAESYVKSLGAAISIPHPPYEALGLKDSNGDFQQLNTSLLQIENEFYSSIRPKRTAHKGETALTALCQRGVEYVEVRCLDIDPFSDIGVNEEQLLFLDTFLLYCTMHSSPQCDTEEFQRIASNQRRVVREGRKPGLELQSMDGKSISLETWGNQLLDGMQPVAALLDHCHDTHCYTQALQSQKLKIANPELTPSARVLRELKQDNLTFAQWARGKAAELKTQFLERPLSRNLEKKYQDMADESTALQSAEEEQVQLPFDQYLKEYYLQYQACCKPKVSV